MKHINTSSVFTIAYVTHLVCIIMALETKSWLWFSGFVLGGLTMLVCVIHLLIKGEKH